MRSNLDKSLYASTKIGILLPFTLTIWLLFGCKQLKPIIDRVAIFATNKTSSLDIYDMSTSHLLPSLTMIQTSIGRLSQPVTTLPNDIELILWAEWELSYAGYTAAWSPDSQTVVFSDSDIYGQNDRTYMYDVNTLEKIWQVDDGASSIIFDNSGRSLVDSSNRLEFWDSASGEITASYLHGNASYYSTFLPNSSALIIGRSWYFGEQDSKSEIGIWNDERKEFETIFEHDGIILNLTLSSDGMLLAAVFGNLPEFTNPQKVIVWSLETRNKLCEISGDAASFSPLENVLAVYKYQLGLNLFDALTCQFVKSITDAAYISSYSFSPDGQYLVYAGKPNGIVWIQDTSSGDLIYQGSINGEIIRLLEFSPDGNYLLSVSFREKTNSNDKATYFVRVWKVIR